MSPERPPRAQAEAQAQTAFWRHSYWQYAASHGAMNATLWRQSSEIDRLSVENAKRDAEIAALRDSIAAANEET